MEIAEKNVKLIAFYLPQYHPIPENDKWWGKGFTEWTNVSKAYPVFEGHYQPHLPADLGFYDLRLSEVREEQARIAKEYGVHGFCYHHYWFGGKRLLERPFNEVLKSGKPDFPFCLCWANENWTRRWDGAEDQILMAQKHSPEDDLAFIQDIMPALKDKRYITVNGKPLLIVYRISLLPNPKNTAAIWREEALKNGLKGLYLVAAQSFGIGDPEPYGFDAAVEFPPHNAKGSWMNDKVKITEPLYNGNIFSYEKVVQNHINQDLKSNPPYTIFRTIMPSWDNTARRQLAGHVFHNSSPEIYQEWLEATIKSTVEKNKEEERIVFINAWNEWAEGCHLEPDKKYGYAFLEATKNALNSNLDIKQKEISEKQINVISQNQIDSRRLKFLTYIDSNKLSILDIEEIDLIASEAGNYGYIFSFDISKANYLFSIIDNDKWNKPFAITVDLNDFSKKQAPDIKSVYKVFNYIYAFTSNSNYTNKDNQPLIFYRNAGDNPYSVEIIRIINELYHKQGIFSIFNVWAIEDEFKSGLLTYDEYNAIVINHPLYEGFNAIAEFHPLYAQSVYNRNTGMYLDLYSNINNIYDIIPNLPQRHDCWFKGWFIAESEEKDFVKACFARQLLRTNLSLNSGEDFFIIGAITDEYQKNNESTKFTFELLKDLFLKDVYDLEYIFNDMLQKRENESEDGYYDSAECEKDNNIFIAYYPKGKTTYNKVGTSIRRFYHWSDEKGIKIIPFIFKLTGKVLLLLGFIKIGMDFINMKKFK